MKAYKWATMEKVKHYQVDEMRFFSKRLVKEKHLWRRHSPLAQMGQHLTLISIVVEKSFSNPSRR